MKNPSARRPLRARLAPLILASSTFLAPIARAADTPSSDGNFQEYLQGHHYVGLPLSNEGVNAQAINAQINGRKVRLIVDSGCQMTCLNYDCARDLRLNVVDTGRKLWGVGGQLQETAGVALMQSFMVGGYEINRTNIIHVLPKSSPDLESCDGFLGLDFLKLNAAIMLVGSKDIILKPGATPVVSLNTYLRALGFTPIPLTLKGNALFVVGHLNGTPFKALVDTGATFSTFNRDFVRAALGSEPISIAMRSIGIDGAKIQDYRFTPDSLDFGGFRLPPIMISASDGIGIKALGANALLGFDLLALHLAVIDLGSNTLWMK